MSEAQDDAQPGMSPEDAEVVGAAAIAKNAGEEVLERVLHSISGRHRETAEAHFDERLASFESASIHAVTLRHAADLVLWHTLEKLTDAGNESVRDAKARLACEKQHEEAKRAELDARLAEFRVLASLGMIKL